MSCKILESDEMKSDLKNILVDRMKYNGYESTGNKFLSQYDESVQLIERFPLIGGRTDISYRQYIIKWILLDDYYIFYIIRENACDVILLRMLHQKQNWKKIMDMNKLYHIYGKAI